MIETCKLSIPILVLVRIIIERNSQNLMYLKKPISSQKTRIAYFP